MPRKKQPVSQEPAAGLDKPARPDPSRPGNGGDRGGGAVLGNTNGTKGRVWRNAIRAALDRRSKGQQISELEKVAEALIDAAKGLKNAKGIRVVDVAAAKEIGDRLDGKVPQAIIGDGEHPLQFQDVSKLSTEELEKLARSD